MFDGHYYEWRARRVRKAIEIIGSRRLARSRVLELGCGYGDIGIALWQIGAEVTFSDARQEHLDELMRRYPEIARRERVVRIDQETPWSLDQRFDLVIHFGLLYHLRNWRLSLDRSLAHSDAMLLESEVADSDDPSVDIAVPESGFDQAFGGQGSRPSAAAIEAHLRRSGCRFLRFDDAHLNAAFHRYDWVVGNTGEHPHGQRRFWLVCRSPLYPPYLRQLLSRILGSGRRRSAAADFAESAPPNTNAHSLCPLV